MTALALSITAVCTVYLTFAGGGFLGGTLWWASNRRDWPEDAKDGAMLAFASLIWPIALPYIVYLMIRDIAHKENR